MQPEEYLAEENCDPIAEVIPEEKTIPPSKPGRFPWLWTLLLLGVLLVAGYFRTVGVNWDENQHLHPDERFLTMVETSLVPVENLSQYFNTSISTLNPHNQGYSYYVYGTLPLFIVRYVAQAIGQFGYDQVHVVGRYTSGIMDLLTVFLVYLIALRLFKNVRLSLLAAAFSACTVMEIQLSHYFTVDTYANFFLYLAFFAAVWVMTSDLPGGSENPEESTGQQGWSWIWKDRSNLTPNIWFGVALGMAMACKVSAAPLTILLPAAAVIYYFRLPESQRKYQFGVIFRNLVAAAIVSVIVFRIFQPYAFTGPGFFGIMPNQKWFDNLKELSLQSQGDVDFPPALQWARRPVWFSWENMVKWGFGLPLGLLAWTAFLWMGYRIFFKGEWRRNLLIWAWSGAYFTWQATIFSRTMRYELPVYPTLSIIAAWAIFALWHSRDRVADASVGWLRTNWTRLVSGLIALVVVASTGAWAYAFTRIYSRPVTRVDASRWVYQNVPGPINVKINTGDSSTFNVPVGFSHKALVTTDAPFVLAFTAEKDGSLIEVDLPHVVDLRMQPGNSKTLQVVVKESYLAPQPLAQGAVVSDFGTATDAQGAAYTAELDRAVSLEKGKQYYLVIGVDDPTLIISLSGSMTLGIADGTAISKQRLVEIASPIRAGNDFSIPFTAIKSGAISQIELPMVVDLEAQPGVKTLQAEILSANVDASVAAQAVIQSDFLPGTDPRGKSYTLQLDTPLQVKEGDYFTLRIKLVDSPGAIALYGSRHALESTWDDPIPELMYGLDAYGYDAGIYRSDLNFELYWDDNADKLQRFKDNLDQADYIYITSNRQWGTTTRVPERYPLTSTYYRDLLGCPDDKEITWCYSVAQPGTFTGQLGFELVKVFQSNPNLGSLEFNTQFAEEAFTVYDHPKVLIFKKTSGYSSQQVASLLDAVDLSKVVHLTPRKVSSYQGDLTLPLDKLTQQREGGTWSQLFNREALQNQYPGVGMVIWYLVIALLGWSFYPFVRLALGGLADRGFPFVRTVAIVVLAFVVWIAGSNGISFSSTTITIAAAALLAMNIALFFYQRKEITEDWKKNKKYYLVVELVILAFFAVDLLIRLGNPDLWHLYKGGEKPMDFSYLNAVLKSTSFPPYDPWFEGGYINYYYYGFVLVAVLVKWLGIVPSIAYNLILPTLFSLLAAGAFCVGYNLYRAATRRSEAEDELDAAEAVGGFDRRAVLAGVASSVGLVILGNLGTIRMIWQGLQRLAAPGGVIDEANFFTRMIWTVGGLGQMINGAQLPYSPGDWYWIPSRVYPGEPITEFPFFTFLYADPHAHLIALAFTVLALGWALSMVLGKWAWGKGTRSSAVLHFAVTFLLGGLAIGLLRPTNTWDYPTYLIFAVIAVLYTCIRYVGATGWKIEGVPEWSVRLLIAVAAAALLVLLAQYLYQPFSRWYQQGYNAVDIWEGARSPFWSYVTHWGLFLFVILTWLVWETRDWMAKTPVSSLNLLRPYKGWIEIGLAILVVAVTGLLILKVTIAWLVLPATVWAGVLILRKGQPDAKRFVLFMIGTGLLLTLVVEVIVLRGDIGRMNTVFKFYLQAWTLLSLSAAASLFWLLPGVSEEWAPGWRNGWQSVLAVLVFCAALFPIMGGLDKIRDRMSSQAPHTLDGMAYMQTSTYSDSGKDMDLSQDYAAIRWMQDHVSGSPVIVEANTPEYRWGSRFTIYTGNPGVVGWNWHQRQQRGIVSTEQVTDRVAAITEFYSTSDRTATENFLKKYGVQYIVLGQLEQAVYPPEGLVKFQNWNGDLWKEVYRDKDTAIYEVSASAQG